MIDIPIKFTIYHIPVAQGRPKAFKLKNGQIRVRDPSKSRSFKQYVKDEALKYIHEPFTGPVSLHIKFYMPRPKRLIWKTKPMPPDWCDKKPDMDNLEKAVKDALEGVAYYNDAQVCQASQKKLYHAGSKAFGDPRPRIEITIEQIREPPDLVSAYDIIKFTGCNVAPMSS